jgi:hypothetical protein
MVLAKELTKHKAISKYSVSGWITDIQIVLDYVGRISGASLTENMKLL